LVITIASAATRPTCATRRDEVIDYNTTDFTRLCAIATRCSIPVGGDVACGLLRSKPAAAPPLSRPENSRKARSQRVGLAAVCRTHRPHLDGIID